MTLGPIQVALHVADALEACGLLYLVGGSVASSIVGEPRTTLDVDMVVAIAETDVDRFLAALGPDFYADDAAMRRAIRRWRFHLDAQVDFWARWYWPLLSLLGRGCRVWTRTAPTMPRILR